MSAFSSMPATACRWQGTNYLVPTDAKLAREGDLDFDAIRLDLVLAQMERETRTSIVLLDACRDNPMAQTLARSMGTRSANIGRGLARIESGVGTFIAFATQPGNVALDGQGRNSPFTAALVKHLPTDAADLGAIMIAVRNEVLASTQGKQVPWEHSSLTGQFFFKPGAPTPAPTAPLVNQPSGDASIEIAFWNSVKDSNDPQILGTYLDRYPSGTFAALARVMMQRLEKAPDASAPKAAALAGPSAAVGGTTPDAKMITLRATLKAREGDTANRPYLGVRVSRVSENLAKAVGLTGTKGASVTQIVGGSPAEIAGVQPGDVIVKLEGINVEDERDLTRRIMDSPSGRDVSLEIWRVGNGLGDFLRWLKDRAEGGDESAIKSLAEAYSLAVTGVGDASEAVRAYRRAADIGDGAAMYQLGVAYLYGSGVGKDESEALRWYRKAGELNEPNALNNLGYFHEAGWGMAKDEAEAVRLYRKSADLGNTDAMVNLSVMLLNGRGAAKDEQQAISLLRQANGRNHARSYYVLASVYEQGLGVGKDLSLALDNYRKAAELGHTDAFINVGFMYERGMGVAKNEVEAVNYYRKAADLNNAFGMTNLGMMLENGRGTKKDVNQAVELYRKAAGLNHSTAMVALGWLYENGKGVKRDNAEAARLYRQAAELGEPQGMHNLAGLLAAGRGVTADNEEAAQWVIKAIERKNAFTIEQMRTNGAAWGPAFRKAFQRQLKEQGVYSGPVDGKFGATTQSAINTLANRN